MQQKLNKLAMALLSRREHSRFELKLKLKRHSQDDEEIERLLDVLEENNYLSEIRFVEAFINARINKGYGPNFIMQALNARGISKELSQQGLAKEFDWNTITYEAYKKKYGDTKPENFAEKAKRQRFLQSRGFLSEQIKEVFSI